MRAVQVCQTMLYLYVESEHDPRIEIVGPVVLRKMNGYWLFYIL